MAWLVARGKVKATKMNSEQGLGLTLTLTRTLTLTLTASSGRVQHPPSSLEAAVARVQHRHAPPLTTHRALIGSEGLWIVNGFHSQPGGGANALTVNVNGAMEEPDPLTPPDLQPICHQEAKTTKWITGYEHNCLIPQNPCSASFYLLPQIHFRPPHSKK